VGSAYHIQHIIVSRKRLSTLAFSIRKECRNQATVSLKVVGRKRRRKCTLESYDRFTNS